MSRMHAMPKTHGRRCEHLWNLTRAASKSHFISLRARKTHLLRPWDRDAYAQRSKPNNYKYVTNAWKEKFNKIWLISCLRASKLQFQRSKTVSLLHLCLSRKKKKRKNYESGQISFAAHFICDVYWSCGRDNGKQSGKSPSTRKRREKEEHQVTVPVSRTVAICGERQSQFCS